MRSNDSENIVDLKLSANICLEIVLIQNGEMSDVRYIDINTPMANTRECTYLYTDTRAK